MHFFQKSPRCALIGACAVNRPNMVLKSFLSGTCCITADKTMQTQIKTALYEEKFYLRMYLLSVF